MPPTTSITITTTSASTAVNATASEANRTGYPRLGFTHNEPPPLLFEVSESLNRCFSLGVGVHLDDAKPLATPHIRVLNDLGALHGAERCEPCSQFRRGYRVAQVTDIEFLSHGIPLLAEFFDR
jgi:hypothetical protein